VLFSCADGGWIWSNDSGLNFGLCVHGGLMFTYLFGFFLGLLLVGMVGEIAVVLYAFRRFQVDQEPAGFPQALFIFAPCVFIGIVGAVAVVVLRAFGNLR
jgi:hypothetical protein